jgi:hypothetical protein
VKSRRERLYDLAAERSREQPAYLGWVLTIYMEAEGLTWSKLTDELGITLDWQEAALCLRPRPEHFAEDVRALSARLSVNAEVLAGVIRAGDALEAMRTPAGSGDGEGTLLAARERPDDETPASES